MKKDNSFFSPLNPVWLDIVLVAEIIIISIMLVAALFLLTVNAMYTLIGAVVIVIAHISFMLSLNLIFNVQKARINTDNMSDNLREMNRKLNLFHTLFSEMLIDKKRVNEDLRETNIVGKKDDFNNKATNQDLDTKLKTQPDNSLKKKKTSSEQNNNIVKTFNLDDEDNVFFSETLNSVVQIMYEHSDGYCSVINLESEEIFKVKKEELE